MAAGRWLQDRTGDISDEEREFIFHSILERETDLKAWVPSFVPINKALQFLDGYLAVDNTDHRRQAIEALRFLRIPQREKRVYIRLECLVLQDPSPEIRRQAAMAICDRGEIAQLVSLLRHELGKETRQHLEDALVYARNQPGVGGTVGEALEKQGSRFQLRVVWNLLVTYRNEIAVTLVLAYLMGQLAIFFVSPWSSLIDRFVPGLDRVDIYWSIFSIL